MAKRFVILSKAIVRIAVILSEAKDLSVTPPLRSRQRWIVFPNFCFLFFLFAFLP
jgi:hypothetical protein